MKLHGRRNFLAAALLTPIAWQEGQANGIAAGRPIPTSVIDIAAVAPAASVHANGRWVLFATNETVDLNGDGDMADSVLQVHDLLTSATTNLGLAVVFEPILAMGGRRALVKVNEFRQGETDLNGDGDVADEVVHVVNLLTGGKLSSGMASSGVPSGALIGDRAVFSAALDGFEDSQAVAWDLLSGEEPVPLGLSQTQPLQVAEHHALILASEPLMGMSLNSDADLEDDVLHVVDLEDPFLEVSNTHLAVAPIKGGLQVRGARAAFLVDEAHDGGDRNGDGDAADYVLHVLDMDAGVLENLALAATPVPFPPFTPNVEDHYFVMGEDGIAVDVVEQPGLDFNEDGDVLDSLLLWHEHLSAERRVLGPQAWDFSVSGGYVAFHASEAAAGADLDADGDAVDLVAMVHDLAAGSTWNVGLATGEISPHPLQHDLPRPFEMAGPWLAFLAAESPLDHNGDGDVGDHVLFLADASAHQTFGQGLALQSLLALPERLVFSPGGTLSFLVHEGDQQADLNGDGDLADEVLHFVHPPSSLQLDAGVATTRVFAGFRHRYPFGALSVARLRF